jgi:hypothetical protein
LDGNNHDTTYTSRSNNNDIFAVGTAEQWWDHPAILAMVGCTVTALCSQRMVCLYGIVMAMTLQVAWIVLRWILFVLDDDDLRHTQRAIHAAMVRLGREWNRLQRNENPYAVVWVAAMAARWPTGIGFAVVQYRYFAHRANTTAVHEIDRKIEYNNTHRPKVEKRKKHHQQRQRL